jgi:hypothetical protein
VDRVRFSGYRILLGDGFLSHQFLRLKFLLTSCY